jgi:GT2 family glycosyltransferase
MSEKIVGVIGVSSGEVSRHASFYDELTIVERPENVIVSHAIGLYINKNRNQLAEHAIELGAEWIWYVDDDHCFHPDTLTRLLARNVDIVTGVAVKRVAPFLPLIYEREEGDEGNFVKHYFTPDDVGLKPILAAGAGCFLVKTHVHKTLGSPYWRFSETSTGDMIGEDMDFCMRARAMGFTVYCDMDAPIGHRTTMTVYPQQKSPGEWMLNIIDSKGTLVVTGPTMTGPVEAVGN